MSAPPLVPGEMATVWVGEHTSIAGKVLALINDDFTMEVSRVLFFGETIPMGPYGLRISGYSHLFLRPPCTPMTYDLGPGNIAVEDSGRQVVWESEHYECLRLTLFEVMTDCDYCNNTRRVTPFALPERDCPKCSQEKT